MAKFSKFGLVGGGGVVGGGVEEFPTHWQHYWCNLSMQATIEMLLWVGPLQPGFH